MTPARRRASARPDAAGWARAALALALALGVVCCMALARAPGEARAASRPNIVVIQTDDMAGRLLTSKFVDEYGTLRRTMPHTMDLIGQAGMRFTNYYATYPLCSPSRTTLLTGQYAHTNGLLRNDGPQGGWEGYQNLPVYRQNLPAWLQRAGYWTSHVGKYVNNYFVLDEENREGAPTIIPPGWGYWVTSSFGVRPIYYGYNLNVNGTAEGPFGSSDYGPYFGQDAPNCMVALACDNSTDRTTINALDAIETAGDRPFYLQVDYHAPHGDARPPAGPEPPARYYDTATRTPLPKPPSFNEESMRDKPRFLKRIARPLSPTEVRAMSTDYRKEVESLRGVDYGVKRIVDQLRELGKLDDTYVIFISDNGFFFGEHRLARSKFLPHEPSARVPLLMRGPAIPRGARSNSLAGNIDLAPTILKLAGAKPGRSMDGHSLTPLFEAPKRDLRRALVLESFVTPSGEPVEAGEPEAAGEQESASASAGAPPENFLGLRIGPYKYVDYREKGQELYDLARDPDELENKVNSGHYRKALRYMRSQLERYEECSGAACRAEPPPWPEPPRPGRGKRG